MQIINHEIWDQPHAIKVKHASQRRDKRQTRKGLLTGLVRCGFCGGIITIIGRERYACPDTENKAHAPMQPASKHKTWNNACSMDWSLFCLDVKKQWRPSQKRFMQKLSDIKQTQRYIRRPSRKTYRSWKLVLNSVLMFFCTQTLPWRAYAISLKG